MLWRSLPPIESNITGKKKKLRANVHCLIVGLRNNRDVNRVAHDKVRSARGSVIDSISPVLYRLSEMPTKIKIDGGDYGIKDESKSSRITSVGSPLWRKGTWNVIARPRNLCAAPNLHSQIVNSALALTLSLRIFGSKLWLHVSCKRREKKFGGKKAWQRGERVGAEPKTALPPIIGRVWWCCTLRVNDPLFPRQIFEALGPASSTLRSMYATRHVPSII